MAGDWQIAAIEDVADKVAMGPFGSSIKVSTFVAEGIPVVSGQHLKGIRLGDGDFNFVTEEHADRLANANVRRGDVVLTHAGSIGQVAYIPANSQFDRYVLSQRQFYIRCNTARVDPRFLTYYLKGPVGQHQLLANASQTGVPSIAQPVSYVRRLRIPVPPLPEQRAIADVLGALDDKIESNGRLCTSIDELLPLLIGASRREEPPDKANLGDLTELRKGVSYRSAELAPSDTAMVSLKCVGRKGEFRSEGPKEYTGTPKPDQLVKPGELIVAQTDLTQGAEVVGRVLRVPAGTGYPRLIASLDLTIVRPREDIEPEYLYAVLLQPEFRQHCRARTTGTTVLHLASDALPTFEFALDSPDVRREVARNARPLLAERDRAVAESKTLASLRDILIPELLSGRLRVPAAKSIEKASA